MLFQAFKLLLRTGPESTVALRWLWHRTSRINRRFAKKASVEVSDLNGFKRVQINSEVFVWPARAPVDDLLIIASEQSIPDHPHQYLWGNTYIREGDVVLDIGACEGSFAARAATLGAKVICIEPSRTMHAVILKLFELRGLAEPTILPALVGERDQQCYFLDNDEHPGSSRIAPAPVGGAYPVDVKSLDAIVQELRLEKVNFIKCDTEGAEVGIIKSGLRTLQLYKPKLALCTYHNDDDFVRLYELLKPLGYSIQGKGFLRGPKKFRVHTLHAW